MYANNETLLIWLDLKKWRLLAGIESTGSGTD
jgi:hypothetical protein